MKCLYCDNELLDSPDGPWCPRHDLIDPAEIDLREYKATHYLWFDDNDKPHVGEGWAGFYTNAIQLSDCKS